MARYKKLVLLLTGLSAFLAINGGAARAGVIEADEYPTLITGSQTEQLQTTTVIGSAKCSTVTGQAEITEATASTMLSPTLSKCTIAGLAETVNLNGCMLKVTAGKTLAGDSVAVDSAIVCPGSEEIKVSVVGSTCETRIPSQTISGGVEAHTNTAASPDDVTVTINVTGVTYTVINGSKCPNAPASGEYTNGELKGALALTGETPGNPSHKIGIRVT